MSARKTFTTYGSLHQFDKKQYYEECGGQDMKTLQLVLITGMGGAGRTTALHTLEDLGYYCVDHLPLVLLSKFLEILGAHPNITRVALCVDIRDALFFAQTPEVLEALKREGYRPELVYLDAGTDVLMRRYKETRRAHPLAGDGDLYGAIERERRMLQILIPFVQTRIDTSALTPHQLRDRICAHFARSPQQMHVEVVSFGFKRGILNDADLVFDVRFLKNPFFVPELSHLTGLDRAVADYVFSDPDAAVFLDQTGRLVEFLVPRYVREGKRYLTIGIGCTGGQHRSVAIAQAIYGRHSEDPDWAVHHRDL